MMFTVRTSPCWLPKRTMRPRLCASAPCVSGTSRLIASDVHVLRFRPSPMVDVEPITTLMAGLPGGMSLPSVPLPGDFGANMSCILPLSSIAFAPDACTSLPVAGSVMSEPVTMAISDGLKPRATRDSFMSVGMNGRPSVPPITSVKMSAVRGLPSSTPR